jgi:hypothetical protein
VNELHDRTVRAAECVKNEILAHIWQQTAYCLDMCRATNGAILRSTEHIHK